MNEHELLQLFARIGARGRNEPVQGVLTNEEIEAILRNLDLFPRFVELYEQIDDGRAQKDIRNALHLARERFAQQGLHYAGDATKWRDVGRQVGLAVGASGAILTTAAAATMVLGGTAAGAATAGGAAAASGGAAGLAGMSLFDIALTGGLITIVGGIIWLATGDRADKIDVRAYEMQILVNRANLLLKSL